MKKMIAILVLPFLPEGAVAQFNTAYYRAPAATVEIKPFDESQIRGTFLDYQIEGMVKRTGAGRKKESRSEVPDAGPETGPAREETKGRKKEGRKRLAPITEQNLAFLERQSLSMPLDEMAITSPFGSRFHPVDKVFKMHSGIDLRAHEDPVYSVLDGIVLEAGYADDAGNYVVVLHSESFETVYAHLAAVYADIGQKVSAGQVIGLSGNTGKSTAPHLHFAVKENGRYVDPIKFLNDLIETNNAILDYGQHEHEGHAE